MPNWKNPHNEAVPVTLESAMRTLDKHFFEPQPYLRRAKDALDEHGNLLDAYYLKNAVDISLAFRFGPLPEQYVSYLLPLAAEAELVWDRTMPHWQASKNADAPPAEGFVYRWSSKALERYAPGRIYVVGGNIQQARELAMIEFDRWLAQNREYLDEPEKDELRQKFKADLSYPPKCATVWLQQGSE